MGSYTCLHNAIGNHNIVTLPLSTPATHFKYGCQSHFSTTLIKTMISSVKRQLFRQPDVSHRKSVCLLISLSSVARAVSNIAYTATEKQLKQNNILSTEFRFKFSKRFGSRNSILHQQCHVSNPAATTTGIEEGRAQKLTGATKRRKLVCITRMLCKAIRQDQGRGGWATNH